MDLEIAEQEREGVTILSPHGRLVIGPELEQLRARVQALVASGKTRLILDLAAVDYIDSSGLGQLVVCHTTLNKPGGGLRLLHLNSRNMELMVITKLYTVFEIFDDEMEAVNSFFPDRRIRKFDILSFVESQKGKAKR